MHAQFLSVWSALEFPQLLKADATSLATRIYTAPRLYTLECMVVAMFLQQGRMTSDVQRVASDQRARRPGDLATSMCEMLNLLLNEFVPALMCIGIAVRDLYWEHRQPRSSQVAKTVLHHCLTLLNALETRSGTEYVRAMSLAALMWRDNVHSELPGHSFVEECLEASLSRLARSMTENQWSTSVDEVSDMFRALGPARSEKHDLVNAGLTRSLVFSLRQRCKTALQLALNGKLVLVTRLKGERHASLSLQWPSPYIFPVRRLLVADVNEDQIFVGVCRSVLCLLQSKKDVNSEQVNSLCAAAPSLTAAQIETRRNRMQQIMGELQRAIRERSGVFRLSNVQFNSSVTRSPRNTLDP